MSSVSRQLDVSGVSVRFGKQPPVVDLASLKIMCGQVVSLLGPSGSGKSSLLRAIAGLEPVTTGQISFAGQIWTSPDAFLPPETRKCGVVFQDYALFPHLNTLDNVAFGLAQLSRKERLSRARECLVNVELEHKAKSYPHELSGGEQQRVALARALAPKPDVMLLDEPFSGLDRRLRTELRQTTINALRQSGTAALVVTHDAEEAMTLADEIVLMQDGRIIQTGRPEDVYMQPDSLSAARLLGDINCFELVAGKDGIASPFGTLPLSGFSSGQHVKLLVRPEGLQLHAEKSSGTRGIIVDRHVKTGFALLNIKLETGQTIMVHHDLTGHEKAGDQVDLRLIQEFMRLIPA